MTHAVRARTVAFVAVALVFVVACGVVNRIDEYRRIVWAKLARSMKGGES